jgi:general secretion pathway protein M
MNVANWLPAGRMRQAVAATSYSIIVAGLLASAAWLALGLYDDSSEVASLRERLRQLDQRAATGQRMLGPAMEAEAGSPLLEGATITLAGAALQQRMERAVARAGAELLSSQVELESPTGGPGFLSLSADIEMPKPALQALLYDIEAGMPYLFVDSLAVQSSAAAPENDRKGRLHVALAVSGKWEAKP